MHEPTDSVPDEPEPRRLRFGAYEMDRRTYVLRRSGEPTDLAPRPAKVLWVLLRGAGRIVTRAEIQDAVWPRGGVELDHAINTCVRQIRQALGDEASEPIYVETHPRRGYRFVAPVEVVRREEHGERPISRVGGRPWRRVSGLAAALALAASAIVAASSGHRDADGEAPSPGPILAVLPFENLTGDPSRDFLARGLTEEVILSLALLDPSTLPVLGRASTRRLERVESPAVEAERLGVRYLVAGSVRGGPGRYRVSLSLTEAGAASPIWVERLDVRSRDLLEIQGLVARRVAETVLSESRVAGALATEGVRAPVRLAHLRARHLLDRGRSGAEAARREFERALALEPTPEGHAGLAWALLLLDRRDEARTHVEAALELDAAHADAHILLAQIVVTSEWDWVRGEHHFRRALELEPGVAEHHHAYAVFLASLGRSREALEEMEHAYRLNPISPSVNADYAAAFLWAGDLERERAHCREVGLLSERAGSGSRCLFWVDMAAADRVAAARHARDWLAAEGLGGAAVDEVMGGTDGLGGFLAWLGEGGAGLPVLRRAAALSYLGRNDRALDVLGAALERRTFALQAVAVDPAFEALRGDPRFVTLVAPLRHPALADEAAAVQGMRESDEANRTVPTQAQHEHGESG